MNLKVFRGAKDIFRDNLPQDTSHQQDFKLTLGAISPVPLYEFELRELFIEATVQSGCKWWLRNSRASVATVNTPRCLWSTSFVCRHYESDYQKRPSDNSRSSRHIVRCSCPASCVMKAISVTIPATLSSFCSHSSRLILPIEDTDIWFSVKERNWFHLGSCVMPFIGIAQRPDCLRGGSMFQTLFAFSNSMRPRRQKRCLLLLSRTRL